MSISIQWSQILTLLGLIIGLFLLYKGQQIVRRHVTGSIVTAVILAVLGAAAFGIYQGVSYHYRWKRTDLPGNWYVLYDQMYGLSNDQLRMLMLEKFLEKANEEPKLPVSGWNRIVSLFSNGNFPIYNDEILRNLKGRLVSLPGQQ